MVRKVILYIAMSLDGFITKDQDNIDFLSIVEVPDEDYGYSLFQTEVDTLIWGRKAYDKLLSFGIDFPHSEKKCYVFSRTRKGTDANVTFYNGDIIELIHMIREEDGKHIYVDGGSQLVFELLKHSLIDSLIISVVPHLIGSGVRLFTSGAQEQSLKFKHSNVYPSGLVQLHYEIVREPQKGSN